MVIRDGKKYACESCIRGHRVSGCTHTDRDLQYIAPKGRPVKQCDHCRGARKAKSHHAKCDCAGRHDRNELKFDGSMCCCTIGDSCSCGHKQGPESRHDAHRANQGRPHLGKNPSEGHLSTYINSHHKAVHRWEKGDNCGTPYPCRKPVHNDQSSGSTHHDVPKHPMQSSYGIAKDDSALNAPPASIYANAFGQLSVDNLPLSSFSMGSAFYPFFSGAQQQACGTLQITSPMVKTENSIGPNQRMPLNGMRRVSASSVPHRSPSSCDASKDSMFTSANLPLSLPHTISQTISNSDESLIAPGLTAYSSTSPSELGDLSHFTDQGLERDYVAAQMLQAPSNDFLSGFDAQSIALNLDMELLSRAAHPESALETTTPNEFVRPSLPRTSNWPLPATAQVSDQSPIPLPKSNVESAMQLDVKENSRRSLDVNTIRSLSAYPDFEASLASMFGAATYNDADRSQVSDAFAVFSTDQTAPTNERSCGDTHENSAYASMNFNDQFSVPAAIPEEAMDRPQSMPAVPGFDFEALNANAGVDMENMFTQLGQPFPNEPTWDAAAFDFQLPTAESNPNIDWLQQQFSTR